MTYGQLGWVDALGFGLALLLEIPTGAVGDLLGKKRTLLLGTLFSCVGAFTIALSSSLSPIFWGWLLCQVGFALYSGTGEALLYDSLVDLNQEKDFDKILSTNTVIEEYTVMLSILLGGFIYVYNFRLPHLLWATGYLGAFAVCFWLREPQVDTIKFSLKNYVTQLAAGAKQLIQPALRKYAIFTLFLSGTYFLFSWGFISPAMMTSFGYNAQEIGIILAGLIFISGIIIKYLPVIRSKISDVSGLSSLLLIMAVGFIYSYFPIGKLGIIGILAISLPGKLARPWLSVIVNREIPSQYRATTLSTLSLIYKAPYVLIAIYAGQIIQAGRVNQFSLGVGLTLLVGLVLGLGVYFSRAKLALWQRK